MQKIIIRSNEAPKPIGPYNQAVKAGNLVFLAGQIPVDPATGDLVAGGAAEQTERVIANIKAVLKSAGTSLDNVVKATVFLKDLNDFGKMNEVYAKHFPADNAPARSTIQVARLPKDSLVEIEVVAVVP